MNDTTTTPNPHQQSYQHQQQHQHQQQQHQQQQQLFNNERSPNGAQNVEQKYRPGMQQQSSSPSSTSENQLGSPLSNSLPLQVQLSEGQNIPLKNIFTRRKHFNLILKRLRINLNLILILGANNMNLNSTIGSNSIGNDDMENVVHSQRNQNLPGRLSGTGMGEYFVINHNYLGPKFNNMAIYDEAPK